MSSEDKHVKAETTSPETPGLRAATEAKRKDATVSSERAGSTDTLTSDFWSPGHERISFYSLKPSSLWSFVTAVLGANSGSKQARCSSRTE